MRYRSTRKSVYSAKYHVIWCPKYRQRVIGGRVEARLKQIIDEAVTECGGGPGSGYRYGQHPAPSRA